MPLQQSRAGCQPPADPMPVPAAVPPACSRCDASAATLPVPAFNFLTYPSTARPCCLCCHRAGTTSKRRPQQWQRLRTTRSSSPSRQASAAASLCAGPCPAGHAPPNPIPCRWARIFLPSPTCSYHPLTHSTPPHPTTRCPPLGPTLPSTSPSLQMGPFELFHRIVMAPLTRCR